MAKQETDVNKNRILRNRCALVWWVLVCVVLIQIVIYKDFTITWSSIQLPKYWLRTDASEGKTLLTTPLTPDMAYIKTENISNLRNNESNEKTGLKLTTIGSNHTLKPSPDSNNVDAIWYKQRQDIISKRKPGDTIKVFLFAHMRGGSTLSGKIFESDPHAVMWYEPGDAFFSYYHGLHIENLPQNDLYFKNMSRRMFSDAERNALSDFYTSMLTCQYQDLPPEALAHHFVGLTNSFMSFKACMPAKPIETSKHDLIHCKKNISSICSQKMVEIALTNNCHHLINATRTIMKENPNITDNIHLEKLILGSLDNSTSSNQEIIPNFINHQQCLNRLGEENNKCMSVAVQDCKNHSLQVVQVNRMKMEDLEPLIQANPDIYVIHYVRDPRGIALSRINSYLKWVETGSSVLKEARLLCHRMAEDLKQRHIMEEKYPGVFTQVKYEDVASRPIETVSDIYSFLGRDFPPKWQSFVEENMHASHAANHDDQGTRVGDAVATANKWKTIIHENDLRIIERFCGNYLREMDYPLYFPQRIHEI